MFAGLGDDPFLIEGDQPSPPLLPETVAGRWIEVALTPIDVDVFGSPTQQMWVPPRGAGTPVVFTIVPRAADLVALRISLYINKWVVRSYRVVARSADDEELVARHADALHAPLEVVRGLRWAMREEFRSDDEIDAGTAPESTPASLVVNLMDGKSNVSTNLPGRFPISIDADLPHKAVAIRNALFALEMDPDSGYRFERNGATPEAMDDSLIALARAGWGVASAILVDEADRKAFRDQTANAPIQVLETALRRDPMPWACIYDVEVHRTHRPRVCHALDKFSAGQPVPPCRSEPTCILGAGDDEREVVCPSHFWGFRSVIEQPLGQLSGDDTVVLTTPTGLLLGEPRPAVVPASSTGSVVGFNDTIDGAAEHAAALAALLARSPTFRVGGGVVVDGDDPVYNTIHDRDIGFLYLFCHAVGGDQMELGDPVPDVGTSTPLLLFGPDDVPGLDQGAVAGGIRWTTGPIVVLNGCHTGAFWSTSMSPFLVALYRNRLAAAVILTEVSVHPELAAWVGTDFTDRLCNGAPVGAALLALRRSLLAENNPCGLLYCVYGDHRVTMGR